MGRIAATKLLLWCWVAIALPLPAQTLAHKGWAGSGLTVAPWWQSAILYNVDPVSFQDSKGDGFGDLRGIVERLDYLQGLGVDVLVLSPLQSGPARAKATQPFDAAYGTPEDLDTLISEASRHKIRILTDLRLSGAQTLEETLSLARFWLSRGVAGLRLTIDSADALENAQLNSRVRELKRLCTTYAGDRVLFWDVALQDAAQRTAKYSSSSATATTQMALVSALETLPRLDAASLHRALAGLPPVTPTRTIVLATDSDDRPRSWDRFGEYAHPVELARILAGALLTAPGAPMLYFGQEIGMATTPAPTSSNHAGNPTPMQWGDARGFTDGTPWIPMGRNTATANVAMEDVDRYSLLNWYRQLTALRHGNAMLREGSIAVMNIANPAVVAWVRTPKIANAMASPVVVLCNLSDRPAVVSIASELRRLAVPTGTGVMRTLATTETPAPISSGGANADPSYDAPVSVNSISLPPFGIYVGELRHAGGLETQPAPVRSRNRH